MKEDLVGYISKCEICQMWNKSNDVEEMIPIIATYPCEKIHIDYHFLPRTPRGNKCLLVIIDHLTKKVWLEASETKESKNVVKTLRTVAKEIHE
jgi:hypothetical protein